MEQTFEEYMQETRNNFVNLVLSKYPHEIGKSLSEKEKEEYLKFRAGCEDLLICFGQMYDKLIEQQGQIEYLKYPERSLDYLRNPKFKL